MNRILKAIKSIDWKEASKGQIEAIASNLKPVALLEDFRSIDRGAPIVGNDMIVESCQLVENQPDPRQGAMFGVTALSKSELIKQWLGA